MVKTVSFILSLTPTAKELMEKLRNDKELIEKVGYVKCDVCKYRFYGEDLDDMFEQLSGHGIEKHPGWLTDVTVKTRKGSE